MGNSGRADLVTDVADALTLDQEVEWERCAVRVPHLREVVRAFHRRLRLL